MQGFFFPAGLVARFYNENMLFVRTDFLSLPKKCRKIMRFFFVSEVIDFNSLLDDYLKSIQSEEDFVSVSEASNKTGIWRCFENICCNVK